MPAVAGIRLVGVTLANIRHAGDSWGQRRLSNLATVVSM